MSKRQSIKVYAVILIGGKGRRLRPLSTDSRPKAFVSVTKDRKTMFAKTLERAQKIALNYILVIANSAHARLARKDFPDIAKGHLILEPVSRNTAPAITLAALTLAKKTEDAVMVVLPTDHYISGEWQYLAAIKNGIDFAGSRDAVVVMAVKPRHPATGFGYIRVNGQGLPAGRQASESKGIFKVEEFVEKPDLKTARRYLKNGNYLWNTGVFIFKVSTILKLVSKYKSEIVDGLNNIKDMKKDYEKLPDISIDYAVMEKADNIYCVRGSYGWNDMGSFGSIKNILKMEGRRFVERGGKITKIL